MHHQPQVQEEASTQRTKKSKIQKRLGTASTEEHQKQREVRLSKAKFGLKKKFTRESGQLKNGTATGGGGS